MVVVVKEIDKELAKRVIEENHYTHKIPAVIKFRFGLYIEGVIKGVAIFSIPSNMHTFTSVFKGEPQTIGIELTRFFTFDDTPKNFESYCLSRCFKYIKEQSKYDVIVSYADPNFGHMGYLYQSLNGLYLGETSAEPRYLYNGQLWTRRSLGRAKEDTEREHVQRLIADGATKVRMKGKHKYLFFICDKRRKKELMKSMKVDVLSSYPKDNKAKVI